MYQILWKINYALVKFFLSIFNASILSRSSGTNSWEPKVKARNKRLGCGLPKPNDLTYQRVPSTVLSRLEIDGSVILCRAASTEGFERTSSSNKFFSNIG